VATGDRVFAALLRYWRGRRGMSQLDLGLAADVSPRHISFLETGRSRPSVEMALLLAETLGVPLRYRNEWLRAAGFDARYPEPPIQDMVEGALRPALDLMMARHEPYPMLAFDRLANVLRKNHAASRLIGMVFPCVEGVNLLRLLFRPDVRPSVDNWALVASAALRRLHRDALAAKRDEAVAGLLAELLAQSDLPPDWRQPVVGAPDTTLMPLVFRVDGRRLAFLMTVTVFDAHQNVAVHEVRVESWFPGDAETSAFCEERLT
jgi:transcriptional regulator with XRE-family HTH domain